MNWSKREQMQMRDPSVYNKKSFLATLRDRKFSWQWEVHYMNIDDNDIKPLLAESMIY